MIWVKYYLNNIFFNYIGVGKTCISFQFTDNAFREQNEITTNFEFRKKIIDLNGKTVKIQIWDTAGNEYYKEIRRTYYKGVIGALLVYDITKKKTFINVTKWLEEIKYNIFNR